MVVLILPVFAISYLCPPCLLCACVCVHEMMPQLQDHTAGVPYRSPCLSHHKWIARLALLNQLNVSYA